MHADDGAGLVTEGWRALEDSRRQAARTAFEAALAGEETPDALAQREAPDVAREEARAAFATFRELGAARAMDRAAAVLRELDAATGWPPRAHGELTAREQEALEPLALDMSNARIAATLVTPRGPRATTSAGSGRSPACATSPRRPRTPSVPSRDGERMGRPPDVRVSPRADARCHEDRRPTRRTVQ